MAIFHRLFLIHGFWFIEGCLGIITCNNDLINYHVFELMYANVKNTLE